MLAKCSRMSLPEIPPFVPHPLLRGGHAQTIAGVYLPGRQSRYRARRHLIDLEDGDQLILHDDRPPDWRKGDRVALLVHGLGGCHGSPYLVRITEKLTRRGVRVFRLDLRGWGAGASVARLPFHAARTADIQAAVDCVGRECPGSDLTLVGFSLGANMVLRLLGQRGASLSACENSIRASRKTYPTAVLAIAPPIDLMFCCGHLSDGFGKVYDRTFAKYLWDHLRQRSGMVPAFAAALGERPPRRIYDFDERFTAPLGGFDSVEHYYETASSQSVLRDIQVPTLILSAADDPIVPGRVFDSAELSPQVQLHLTQRGGHLGFIASRNGEPDRRWLDWRVVDFVTQSTNDQSRTDR